MNTDKLIGRHCFVFNNNDNGGESLSLETKVYSNGDPGGFYLNQTLNLQSYSNSASFNLFGAVITPSALRQLANQLEMELIKAKASTIKPTAEDLCAEVS